MVSMWALRICPRYSEVKGHGVKDSQLDANEPLIHD